MDRETGGVEPHERTNFLLPWQSEPNCSPWICQLWLWVVFWGVIPAYQELLAGTWTPLLAGAPAEVSLMLLLSDGTVMAAGAGVVPRRDWYRLTPDIHGSYVNGQWTVLAPM